MKQSSARTRHIAVVWPIVMMKPWQLVFQTLNIENFPLDLGLVPVLLFCVVVFHVEISP